MINSFSIPSLLVHIHTCKSPSQMSCLSALSWVSNRVCEDFGLWAHLTQHFFLLMPDSP
jgi:hypothetical protein